MDDDPRPAADDLHTAAAGVCVVDRQGRLSFCDAAAERILVDPRLGEPLRASIPWAPAGLETHGHQDGQLRGRHVRMTWTPAPEHLAGVGTLVVVAERGPHHVLESALQVARETLRSLVDACPVGIVTLDVDMCVTRWNPAAEDIFGWRSAEVIARPYPLVPAEEWSGFVALFERVMGGEGFTGVEGRRARKDGSIVDLRIHTAPMRDPSGQVVGALALLEDLSERRQLEERVRHAQTMEAVGRLAGGVAHDFNNMLAVILGISEVLLLRPDTPLTDQQQALREMIACAERARKLTTQLLAFSRRQVLSPEVADLRTLITNTTNLLESVLGEEVRLVRTVAPRVVSAAVRVDTNQFDQLLVNLAVNARAAMPVGGTFTLHVDAPVHAPRQAAESVLAGTPDFALLVVSDDGTGIEAAVLPHIFDPFFTTKSDGTGLGLASVYGIVQQSGGFIEVDSECGRGTQFRLYFPLVVEDPPGRDGGGSAAHECPPVAAGEHILLVEDEAVVRQVTAQLLSTLGYRVTTAVDGLDAIEQLQHLADIDLVVTDLSMPRLGGRGLSESLARTHPCVPLVFMSAHLDLPELQARVEAGEAHFVQKPATREQLALEIRRALARPARGTLSAGHER